MNRTFALGLTALLGLAGCAASGPHASNSTPGPVSMGALEASESAAGGTFYFGAGDALGQELFTYYVASVRAQEFYATGASDFIVED